MKVIDQIRVLYRKIMQNEAQYGLDRKAAKISALSSNNLGKYEYLTGEDLGLKPSTVEQAKFQYSLLGKIFNKWLVKDDDKREGLSKRLKNIEDENKEQLEEIEDQKEIQTKLISKDRIKAPLLKIIYNQEVKNERTDNDEAKKIFKTLQDMESSKTDYSKLIYKSGDSQYFNFNRFAPLSSVYLKLVNRDTGINVLKLRLQEFQDEIDKLTIKKTKKDPYKTNKKRCLRKC